MKIISNQKRSKVYYNSENDTFTKIFFPKYNNQLKYFFRLRKYPGHNVYYISNELKKLNLKTFNVISYKKYEVIMSNIHGISLREYLKIYPKKSKNILFKFCDIIATILKNNIYSGDIAYGNFIVKDDEIYIIDLEDYRKVKFLKRDNKEAIQRMKGKVDDWVIEEVKKRLKIQ